MVRNERRQWRQRTVTGGAYQTNGRTPYVHSGGGGAWGEWPPHSGPSWRTTCSEMGDKGVWHRNGVQRRRNILLEGADNLSGDAGVGGAGGEA
jgi:hypothetical protein